MDRNSVLLENSVHGIGADAFCVVSDKTWLSTTHVGQEGIWHANVRDCIPRITIATLVTLSYLAALLRVQIRDYCRRNLLYADSDRVASLVRPAKSNVRRFVGQHTRMAIGVIV